MSNLIFKCPLRCDWKMAPAGVLECSTGPRFLRYRVDRKHASRRGADSRTRLPELPERVHASMIIQGDASILNAGTKPPQFFVNVASKGFRFPVSDLESTFTAFSVSVDSKRLTLDKNRAACRASRRYCNQGTYGAQAPKSKNASKTLALVKGRNITHCEL